MSKFLRASCIGVVALLAVTAVLAQEFPRPGPEHAKLKALEGTWDTVTKFGEQETPGTMVYKMGVGGLWLVGDFRTTGDGEVFQGKSLESYDAGKKKYVNIWIDSVSTSPMVSEGTYDAAGKVVTMIGSGPGFDGQPAKYRTTVDHSSADKFLMAMYVIGADGQEQQVLTVTYTRRK